MLVYVYVSYYELHELIMKKNMYIWDRMLFMGESLFMKTLGSEV